jgi:sec-independent protein translocase protein TatA
VRSLTTQPVGGHPLGLSAKPSWMLDAGCWMLDAGSAYNGSARSAGGTTAMLGPIGAQELIIIFVIALLVFGPRKLPQLGKSLGRSIGEFKRASNELRNTLEQEIRVEETRKEIMEPIETLSNEAKEAVKKATEIDPSDVDADLEADLEDAGAAPPPEAESTATDKPRAPNESPETKA